MATSMSVQSMIFLQLKNSEKDDGVFALGRNHFHKVIKQQPTVCTRKTCTNVITMLETVPTLYENSCTRCKME